MLDKILKREDVTSFIKEITTRDIYLNKDIPNKINGEKINKTEYPVYIFIDAIIKYAIIIDNIDLFDNYLEQLKRIMKKVESHNDIQMGIIKLLIKYASHKLNITDLDNEDKKKKLIEYFYQKYIVDGYFYHSFPSIYIKEIKTNGLHQYNKIENLNEIDELLKKYKIEGIFSKELEKQSIIGITDSFFMAYYYAISSPNYLKKICVNLLESKKIDTNAYIEKDYNKCRENIIDIIKRKEIKEKQKLLDFLDFEWNRLDIDNAVPMVAIIKRSTLNKNSLSNYNNILEKSNENDISISIRKIFESKYNEEDINLNIPADKLTILELPDIRNYCKKEEKKTNTELEKLEAEDLLSVKNEVGSATIVALLGVLLITLGVTITIIMLGK